MILPAVLPLTTHCMIASMAGLPQIRGMLLEEVILLFLEANGYQTVSTAGTDPTLRDGSAGLEVLGRGTKHQIDGIADYRLSPPFSHPYRLLVEAKSLDGSVGLGIVRNALGVVRDVAEYWAGRNQPRFHYQYAVFADTQFTGPAQDFAFVQDIFLLPLRHAASMRQTISAIRAVRAPMRAVAKRELSQLRQAFRASLRTGVISDRTAFTGAVVEAARNVGRALVGMALNGMPLLLVPDPDLSIDTLPNRIPVRIAWDEHSWYLRTVEGRSLFTFDIPPRLFAQYADRESLGRRAALDLKEEALSEIQATVFTQGTARIIRFVLDTDWIYRVRERLDDRDLS